MFRIDVPTAAGVVPVPSAAGTPGYFTNGNPSTSTASTVVDADWLNMIQEELVNVVLAAPGPPALSKTTRTQVRDAIAALIAVGASATSIQAQAGNYVAAGGTANAITGTFTPAVAAHIVGAPLRVKIGTTNTGAVTFNPGPGVKSVVTPQGGALQAGELVAGAIATFEYDGTNYQYLEATNALIASAVGNWQASNLLIQQNAGTPTTQVDISADKLVLLNANGVPFKIDNFSTTINAALNGAINRLDTGALANNTAYDVWAAAKSDGTGQGAFLSLASNTSTNFMGATTTTTLNGLGYTGGYFMRLGTVITNGSAQFRRTIQVNRDITHIVAGVTAAYPTIISGASGAPATPTYTGTVVAANSAIAGAMIPTKAKKVKLLLNSGNVTAARTTLVAPSNAFGTLNSANPPPMGQTTNNTSQTDNNVRDEFILESTSVYYASDNPNAGLFLTGWSENINA